VTQLTEHIDIHCESPEIEVWRYLDLLATPSGTESALRQVYGDGLGHKLLSDKVGDFAKCVRQAKEYFHALQHVTMATAPVLCYYGMLSLATSLAVFSERNLTLRGVPRAHGLCARGLDLCRDILDAACVSTKSGIFPLLARQGIPDWCTVTEVAVADDPMTPQALIQPPVRRALSRTFTDSWASSVTLPHFTLREVVSRLPDLDQEVRAHPEAQRGLLYCDVLVRRQEGTQLASAMISVSSDDPVQLEALSRMMAEDYPDFPKTEASSERRLYQTGAVADPLAEPLPCIRDSTDGETYIVVPNDRSIPLMPEVLDWMIGAFLLASLARYFPQIWLGRPGARPETILLSERFVRIARRRFPNLVLNSIYGRSLRFLR